MGIENIKLVIERTPEGEWKIEFTNLWLPRDVHQAKMCIDKNYKNYKRMFSADMKKIRGKVEKNFKETLRESRGRKETVQILEEENSTRRIFEVKQNGKIELEAQGVNNERK